MDRSRQARQVRQAQYLSQRLRNCAVQSVPCWLGHQVIDADFHKNLHVWWHQAPHFVLLLLVIALRRHILFNLRNPTSTIYRV